MGDYFVGVPIEGKLDARFEFVIVNLGFIGKMFFSNIMVYPVNKVNRVS